MRFKKFLIVSVALLLLVGIFFAGAVFGSRYQLEQRYGDLTDTTDTEETTTQDTTTQEPEEDEAFVINQKNLIDLLESRFSDNDTYDTDAFYEYFTYVNVHENGRGFAVDSGSGGLSSIHEGWYTTSDYGKTWNKLGTNSATIASYSFVYLDDTVIRTMGDSDMSHCHADLYREHGQTFEKGVSVETLLGCAGDKEINGVSMDVVYENNKENTVMYGFYSIENNYEYTKNLKDKEYFYIAEYDTDLNLVKEIYKNKSVYDAYVK